MEEIKVREYVRDKDIEIEGFEGETIKCSPFTEKVGKDIIDYKYEYEIQLKVIEMFSQKLSEKEKLLELANNKISELVPLKNEAYEKYCEMRKELETYKKIADEIDNMFGEECTKLGSYEKDNATPEKERIAGGINILNKLRKRLDWAKREVEANETHS